MALAWPQWIRHCTDYELVRHPTQTTSCAARYAPNSATTTRLRRLGTCHIILHPGLASGGVFCVLGHGPRTRTDVVAARRWDGNAPHGRSGGCSGSSLVGIRGRRRNGEEGNTHRGGLGARRRSRGGRVRVMIGGRGGMAEGAATHWLEPDPRRRGGGCRVKIGGRGEEAVWATTHRRQCRGGGGGCVPEAKEILPKVIHWKIWKMSKDFAGDLVRLYPFVFVDSYSSVAVWNTPYRSGVRGPDGPAGSVFLF